MRVGHAVDSETPGQVLEASAARPMLVIALLGSAQSSTARSPRGFGMRFARSALARARRFSLDQLSLVFAGVGAEAPEAPKKIAEAMATFRSRTSLRRRLARSVVALRYRRTGRERSRDQRRSLASPTRSARAGNAAPRRRASASSQPRSRERREKLACDSCGNGVVVAASEKVDGWRASGPRVGARM